MNLKAALESLLFVAAKPLRVKDLAALCQSTPERVMETLDQLAEELKKDQRGIALVKQGQTFQMVTAPDQAGLIKEFVKDETMGELTRPSLEALTIIAYRGPITKID